MGQKILQFLIPVFELNLEILNNTQIPKIMESFYSFEFCSDRFETLFEVHGGLSFLMTTGLISPNVFFNFNLRTIVPSAPQKWSSVGSRGSLKLLTWVRIGASLGSDESIPWQAISRVPRSLTSAKQCSYGSGQKIFHKLENKSNNFPKWLTWLTQQHFINLRCN